MKLLFRNPLAKPGAMLALALAGILSVGAAQAAGTVAGTPITNLATLSYSVGATAQSPIGSSAAGNSSGVGTSTSFLVDNKINLTVATVDVAAVSVVPGTNGVATFTVTNNGNSVQDFSLVSANLATGANVLTVLDNFDTGACSAFVESAAVPNGYQVGTDTATFIDELAPDASKTVYVVCPILISQLNNDAAAISLTATALVGGAAGQGAALVETAGANTAGVDIVFADAAGTDDAVRSANHSSRDIFKVVTATLTVTKAVAPVCDPFNGNTNPKNVPGAFVRYTITVANTGTASASLTSISDSLTSLVTFDSDMIGGLSAAACVAGGASEAGGAPLSGIKILNTARTAAGATGYPKYRTSAADADGAGVAPVAGVPTLTVNFATVLPSEAGYLAGELKQSESVSVVFQVKIN
jgi:uncharacterized repeat protein (TIGR01451 family)